MSTRAFAIRIYVIALVLRLIPVLLSRGLGIGLDDMFQYDMLARSLVAGNGYRWYARADLQQLEPYVTFDFSSVDYDPVRGILTSFRAPLYPAFLAGVYSLSGVGFDRFFAARLAQAVLLSAPLAPLTYFFARLFLAGAPGSQAPPDAARLERAARLSAWVIALYPMLLLFPLGLGTENLFFVLFLAAAYYLMLAAQRPSSRLFAVSGLLLGLAALTRSVILPAAGLAIMWVWLDLKQKRGAVVMALTLLLIILPWIVRNSLVFGKPSGIESSLGYQLYLGYHPDSTGTFLFGPSLDLVPILNDSVRDQIGTGLAIDFIRADPVRLVPLIVSRLGHFFRLELRVLTYFYSSNLFGYMPLPLLLALAATVGVPFTILSISAALGAPLLPWDERSRLLALLTVGYMTPHILIIAEDRFHLTLVPFMVILAANLWTRGLPALTARYRASVSGRVAVGLAAAVCALLLINWTYQFGSEAAKYAVLLGPSGNESYFPY